ncbi:GNAT family N-acetyltransferase [Nonomuraea terrae]|uniref:GNAT family N-acetyltransferase n=1 Tax=Nonomuraea terrae TaxID=2530383 RepID=UPI0037AB8928
MTVRDAFDIVPFDSPHADGVSALARAEGWPTFSDPGRVRRLFAAPGVVGLVAVHHVDVVGAAHLLTDGHHGYLTFLAVSAGRRRDGIGRRLVEEAFEATGAERIDLLSTPEAEPFYRRLPHREMPGFRVFPEWMRPHPGPGL